MGQKPERRPTTPEEEGIEFHDDAEERFEDASRKFIEGVRPAAKPAVADRPQKRDRERRARSSR
jgi:hypothetical protein